MTTQDPERNDPDSPAAGHDSDAGRPAVDPVSLGEAGVPESQETRDDSESAPAPETERESVGGVFAVALGLVVIAISVLPLLAVRMQSESSRSAVQLQEVDGEALLAERFDRYRIPAGMEVVDALRLGGGQEVVILSDPAAWGAKREAEAEIWDAIEKRRRDAWREAFSKGSWGGPGGSGGRGPGGRGSGRRPGGRGGGMPGFGGGGFPTTDWKDVDEGAAGQAPWELAFAWYPREAGEELLRQQFGRRGFGDLRFVGSEGGKVTIDQGPVSWAGYDTHFVVEREFGKVDGEKVFRDSLRINLSLGNRACVLYARWEQGTPGSVEAVQEVLSAFEPIRPA